MVVLNKIYTKTGDAGETALGNGSRVAKHSARVTAYGTVDEANAALSCVAVKIYDTFGFDGMADLIYYDESFLENGSNNSGTYEDLINDSRFAQCFSSCNVPIPREIQD